MTRHHMLGLIGGIWIGLGIADENWSLKLAGLMLMAVAAWLSHRDKSESA